MKFRILNQWFYQAQSQLVSSNQLPGWLLDNRFVVNWYRKPGISYRQCIVSIFQLHNQTLNIWTHLLGFILAQYHCLFLFPAHVTNPIDVLVVSFTYLGITMSFYCSVVYHVFNTCTHRMSCFLSQVDYFGIILHLIGNIIAVAYFAYYNDPTRQLLYIVFYAVVGGICLAMNYHSMLSSVTNKMSSNKRVTFFIIVAVLSVPPQIEIGITHSWILASYPFAADCSYVLAASVYLLKYPERLCPGQYDLFNSHCLFHLLIILAGYLAIYSISLISHAAIMPNSNTN